MPATAAEKKKIDRDEKGGAKAAGIVVLVVLVTIIAGLVWFFAIRNTTPEPRYYDIEHSELESRGFTDVQYVSTLKVTSTPVEVNGDTPPVGNEMLAEETIRRFNANLDDCRVRVHIDSNGLVVLFKDEYRVVDPDKTLLQDDPVFGVCLTAPEEPVG